ncbi:uncharacterized protein LOC115924528 [Strongylocentrotus purpuratus]|uniref:CCHC-type domain-containing protein n=1 Tax=Strongylocentrotus purpuratus TaxID=7668 RepID=A0A7M7NZ51_STRPU|nr:uncharacterized protein LOC115924528 [Strongylocentrotus purpuratus]
MADFDIEKFLSQDLTIGRLRQLRKVDLTAVGTKLSVNLTGHKSKAEIIDAISAHAGLIAATAAAREDAHTNNDSGGTNNQGKATSDEVDLDLAKIELEERRDRIKAAEHEREMERKRLEFEMMRHHEMTSHGSQSGERDKRSIEAGFSARVKLVPRYDENELDSFFLMFERVAKRMEWPEDEWALLIQQVISGKAQSVVSALSYEQAFDYWTMKDAILQSFELIPEAYRQRFRNLRRETGETCVEFAWKKEVSFDQWIRSLKIDATYDSLREVMLIDELKRCMSQEVRTYVNDNVVSDVRKAAMLADGYELTHKGSSSPLTRRRTQSRSPTTQRKSGNTGTNQSSGFGTEGRLLCAYCKKEGHLKTQCPRLKVKGKNLEQEITQPSGFVRIAAVDMQKHVMNDHNEIKRSDQVRDVGHDEEIDEGFLDFVSYGTVRFSVDNKECPITILRDTGSMKTLLIADESSLDTKNFTGKKVLVQDVNDGLKPVPLYTIELSSGFVSGPVTVGIVTKLPMRGISMLLGNDLAGSKVSPSPVVCNTPVGNFEAGKLESEVPGFSPSCVVTGAQAMKKKEDDKDGDVNLGDTFSRTLEEGQDDQSHATTIFSQPALIEAQKAAEDLKMLCDVALPAGEAEKVLQCYSTKCGVLMSKPVLDAPNFQKPFQLAADASDVGVDAVLLQMDDMGLLEPISYFSKKLNPHQRRCSTIEECLGLVLPVQRFNGYLSNSSEVTVFTDHNPLTLLERFRNENQRLCQRSMISSLMD